MRMKRPRMRPTFTLTIDEAPDAIFARISERLARDDCPVSGLVARHHVELTTCRARRHTWSPILVVEPDPNAPEGRGLRGRFAPHPNVWTGFMALYGILSMGAIGATMFGLIELRLDMPPWALLGAPLAIVVGAFVYGAAFIGQGLGADEMYEMRSFLDRCVEHRADRASERPPSSVSARAASTTRSGGIRYE